MAFVHSGRPSARAGRARLTPGGLACAASARRLFTRTPLQISNTLKMASGVFSVKAITRLAPSCS